MLPDVRARESNKTEKFIFNGTINLLDFFPFSNFLNYVTVINNDSLVECNLRLSDHRLK